MSNDFSTGKSILVLGIVAGCFAILWPNVFYPMLTGSFNQKDSISSAQGCCDVIFDVDVNAIKVMTDICQRILAREIEIDPKLFVAFQQGKLTKDIVNRCQKTVFDQCKIDIAQFLIEKDKLGRSYKQMVDEIRSLNSSLCLKQSFGVSLGEIGLPRTIRVWGMNRPKHMRQERPPHLRPEFLHPALREKGRAIPHNHNTKVHIQPGKAPLPGMRPPMGGPGQVVPPPKGSGTMGIVMPMYTIGIIVFFLYTMMKLLFKKTDSEAFDNFSSDPHFRKSVLRGSSIDGIPQDGSQLVISAISGLVEEVNRQIRSQQPLPSLNKDIDKTLEDKLAAPQLEEETEIEETRNDSDACDSDGKNVVKVVGMETTESCNDGSKWNKNSSRPSTPQSIFIAGSLPCNSQLLVSQSQTETVPNQENAVVLTGKVTLSLIGLSQNSNEASAEEEEAIKKESNQTNNVISETMEDIAKKSNDEITPDLEVVGRDKSGEQNEECLSNIHTENDL